MPGASSWRSRPSLVRNALVHTRIWSGLLHVRHVHSCELLHLCPFALQQLMAGVFAEVRLFPKGDRVHHRIIFFYGSPLNQQPELGPSFFGCLEFRSDPDCCFLARGDETAVWPHDELVWHVRFHLETTRLLTAVRHCKLVRRRSVGLWCVFELHDVWVNGYALLWPSPPRSSGRKMVWLVTVFVTPVTGHARVQYGPLLNLYTIPENKGSGVTPLLLSG
mmetsp:Transcript_26977/g.52619  ORF Transcript_26977/g.52619 Transcript_26977/m.52619 type:complete len:220 (-) Transcript_26977:343-1002(-)